MSKKPLDSSGTSVFIIWSNQIGKGVEMTLQDQAAQTVSWRMIESGIMVVTMAHGPANPLSPVLLDGLHAACAAAETAGDVKVMIIESALDGYFAAGADIKHLTTIDAESFTAYGDQMRAVNDRLEAANWLSIAAVDGVALGGGMELSMACTFRVSGPQAAFGLPEVKIGLIPGAGGTQRLPRLVGRGRALDIIVTGRQVPAAEAFEIGLVDRLAAGSSLEGALELARQLTKASLPAQLAGVRAVNAAFDLPQSEGADYEVVQEQQLFEHGEASEGLQAFVQKRKPNFR